MALSERLAILLETVGGDAVVRDFNKISKASGQVGAETTGLASKFGISSAAMAAGATAAAGAVTAFAVGAVNHYQDLAQEVLKFSRASGASAEQSSQLVAALDDMGIAADTGARAMFQLGRRSISSADDLADFGVEIAKDARGNTNLAETLLNVSDAYTRTADPAQRAALLTAAFGRSGQDLIPILEKGRSGIEEMFGAAKDAGQIFDQGDLDRSEQFRLAIDELGDATGKLTLALGEFLVPALTDLATAAANAVGWVGKLGHAMGDVGKFEIFGASIGGIAKTLGRIGLGVTTLGLSEGVIALADGSDKAAVSTDKLGSAFGRLAATTRGVLEAQKEAAKQVDDLQKDLFAVTSAQRSYEDAQQSVTDATKRQRDAQRSLADLLKAGAVDQKAVAAATRDAASAVRDKERADRAQADAQAEVNRLQGELKDLLSGKTGAEATASAKDEEAKAQLRLRAAYLQHARASERLAEIEGDLTVSGNDREEALLNMAQADANFKEAEQDLARAHDRVSEAQKIGAENSQAVIDKRAELKSADERLKEALIGVSDATQAVIDKQTALQAAQAGDPAFNDKVRQAREDVATAVAHVADAQRDASEKAYTLRVRSDELSTAMRGNESGVLALRDKLAGMNADPAVTGFLQPAINQLDLFNRKLGGGTTGGAAGGDNIANKILSGGLFGGGALNIPPVVVNVAGNVLTERQLVDAVVAGINRQAVSGGGRLLDLR